jgi:hypothetical protein
MSWFCRHKWVKTHVETLESPVVRMGAAGKISTHNTRVLMGTFICILTCDKCGAIDKTVREV